MPAESNSSKNDLKLCSPFIRWITNLVSDRIPLTGKSFNFLKDLFSFCELQVRFLQFNPVSKFNTFRIMTSEFSFDIWFNISLAYPNCPCYKVVRGHLLKFLLMLYGTNLAIVKASLSSFSHFSFVLLTFCLLLNLKK